MAKLRFSRRAKADLFGIAEYTIRQWGESQAERYIGELEDCAQMLTANPRLGRACDYILPDLRRYEHGKHVLFYRQDSNGIVIFRILHQRMLPERHAIDDE